MQQQTRLSLDRDPATPFIISPPADEAQRDFLMSFRQSAIDEPDLVKAGMEAYFGMAFSGVCEQEERIQRTDRFIEQMSGNPKLLKIVDQLRVIISSDLYVDLMDFEQREGLISSNPIIQELDRTIEAYPGRIGFEMQRRGLRLSLGLLNLDKIPGFAGSSE